MRTKNVYVIEGRDDGVGSGWSTDSIGDHVEFDSREEAESMLDELLAANPEWDRDDCRVTAVAEGRGTA